VLRGCRVKRLRLKIWSPVRNRIPSCTVVLKIVKSLRVEGKFCPSYQYPKLPVVVRSVCLCVWLFGSFQMPEDGALTGDCSTASTSILPHF